MASTGRAAAAKPKGGTARAASGTFHVTSREEATALEAVKRLATRSAGRPLDDAARAEMEACFGHDFSRVRIHTDDAANEVAEALGAEAVTLGENIYFAEGEYRPGDPATEELLAHELAHVAQRGELPGGDTPSRISDEDEALEVEADALAREVARGNAVGDDVTSQAEQAARTIALRATRPAKRKPRPKEPTPPLGEKRIVDRLAGILLGDFWKDPDDKAGRVRAQLERLGETVRHEVIDVIDGRLNDADKVRFAALVHAEQPLGTEVSTPEAKKSDGTSREQRDEKTDDEKAELRSSDPKSAEAGGGAETEAGKTDETDETTGKDAQEEPDKDDERAEDITEAGDEASGVAGEEASAHGEHAAKKGGKHGKGKKGKGRKGKKARGKGKAKKGQKAEKQGEKDPKTPHIGDGKGEGEDGEEEKKGGEGEAKGEGAEGEAKGGAAGEAERPSAGGGGEGEVDMSGFDRLLAKRSEAANKPQAANKPEAGRKSEVAKKAREGGLFSRLLGRSAMAGVVSRIFGGMRGGAADGGGAALGDAARPEGVAGGEATPMGESTAAEREAGAGKEDSAEAPAETMAPGGGAEGAQAGGGSEGGGEGAAAEGAEAKGAGEEGAGGGGAGAESEGGSEGGGEGPAAKGAEPKGAGDEGEGGGGAGAEAEAGGEGPGAQAEGPGGSGGDGPGAEAEGASESGAEGPAATQAQGTGEGASVQAPTGPAEASAPAADVGAGATPAERAEGGAATAQAAQAGAVGSTRQDSEATPTAGATAQAEPEAQAGPPGDPAAVGPEAEGPLGEVATTATEAAASPSAAGEGEARTAPAEGASDGAIAPETVPVAAEPAAGIGSDAGGATGEVAAEGPERGGAEGANEPGATEAGGAEGAGGPEQEGAAGCAPGGAKCCPGGADGGGEAEGGDEAAAFGSGGGGGGGGGGAIADKPAVAAPDVSNASPPEAMAAMAGLPPATLQASLGQVTAASGRAVGDKRTDLASNPPQVERPSGAPEDHPPTANPGELAAKVSSDAAGKVDAVPAGAAAPAPTPGPVPAMAEPQHLPNPSIPGDTKVDAQNLAQMQAATEDLPTTDPALTAATAGDTPKLDLTGDADPARTSEQRTKLDTAAKEEQEKGAKDAAQPMGEDGVYPKHPAETLKATIPEGGGKTGGAGAPAGGGAPAAGAGGGAGGAGGGAAGGAGAADDETASIVAQEQHGDELATHVQTQSGAMTTAQQKQETDAETQKKESQKAVDDSIKASAKEQEQTRTDVKKGVGDKRKEWTEGQKKLVTTAQGDADVAAGAADTKIAGHRTTGEAEAAGHIKSGDERIVKERQDAEKKARAKKTEAKQNSSQGFFDWIGSKIKGFFDAIKSAIKDAFDWARNAVKAIIKEVQKLAVEAIEKARKAIVEAIQVAGAALMAAADVMLAGFPTLRDKVKKEIQDKVDAAIEKVNAAADELKKDVVAALDLLGKGLDALLGLLLDALNAAIDAVASYVNGIISVAKGFVQALGVFAVLIKDIWNNPGQWLSNLGAAVVAGIKGFPAAIVGAIKKWFDSVVGDLIGAGKQLLDVLLKGCITWAVILKMAWKAMVAAIPGILIQILIEKLVAMIVPAAGALMTIIEGLKAAWGTIQQIIAAFETFMKFLKAIKSGGAGPLFAETLASAAIVIIQFVAQWVLGKLKGAGGKVGGRLKEIATKILGALKKGAQAVGRFAKRVGGALVKGAKAVGRALVKGAKWVGGKLKQGAKWVGGKVKGGLQKIANSKLGKAFLKSKVGKLLTSVAKKGAAAAKKVWGKIKAGVQKAKQRLKDRYEKRKAKRKQKPKLTPQERLEKAVAAIRPQLRQLLDRGVGRIRLGARLLYWRARHRLRSLRIGEGGVIVARVNPEAPIEKAEPAHIAAALEPLLAEAERMYLSSYEARKATSPSFAPDPTVEDVLTFRQIQKTRVIPEALRAGTEDIEEFRQFKGRVKLENVPLVRAASGGTVELRNIRRLPRYYVRDLTKASYEGLRRSGVSVPSPKEGFSDAEKTLLALESARWRGNLPAASVAEALVPSGVFTREDVLHGAGNPMGGTGTAVAGEYDYSGRNVDKTPKGKRGDFIAKGRAHRREQVHAVFERLRHAVHDEEKRKAILASPAGQRLTDLANAFEAWLNAGLPALDPENPGAGTLLLDKLYVFLRTYRG